MTDDIVNRLRAKYSGQLPICTEAADEIERLRSVISDIQKAVTDEGRSPAHHQKVIRKHRKEWPVLWKAIDKATKGIKQ